MNLGVRFAAMKRIHVFETSILIMKTNPSIFGFQRHDVAGEENPLQKLTPKQQRIFFIE
jgi:hypothetical protein